MTPGALPAPADKRQAVQEMFDRISRRYDLVNRLMSMGMDMRWRRLTVESLRLPSGSLVLDIACGTGDICRLIAAAGMRPVGIDLSLGMLQHAKTDAPLIEGDALALPLKDASVDGITCGFALRNVVSIQSLFKECARILRPGGRAAFLEVDEPNNKLLRAGHHVYFHRVVPAIGGLISDKQAYRYLPESVTYLPPSRELMRMLDDAGFAQVEHRALGAGAAQIISATRQ